MKKMIPILIAALLLVALIPTVAYADEAKPANSDVQVPEIPTILIAPIPKIKIGEIEVPRDAKAEQEAAERIQKLLSGEKPLEGSGETPNVTLLTIAPIPKIKIGEIEVPSNAKAEQEAAERIQKLLNGEEPLEGSGETPNIPLHTIVPIPTIGNELNATDINRQPAA